MSVAVFNQGLLIKAAPILQVSGPQAKDFLNISSAGTSLV